MKNVLLFGASGGMGTALSHRLHQQGASMMLAGRNESVLRNLAAETGAEWIRADVTMADEAEAACAAAVDRLGSLDGVVNLAGSLFLKPAHRTSPEDFAQVLQVNLVSAFNTVRAAVEHLSQGGSIVLISSVAAQLGLVNHEAIAAAKAGVEGLARAAAATYAKKGIRVNVVAPSLIRTPMTAGITGNELALKATTAMHPLGRVGAADDVADCITWLLDAEWMTGQVIGVDGGLSSVRPR